jgi:hypothetical protein
MSIRLILERERPSGFEPLTFASGGNCSGILISDIDLVSTRVIRCECFVLKNV